MKTKLENIIMCKTNSRLQKAGFFHQLPDNSNIDDFEVITISNKSGEKIKMYRRKKEQIDKEELEDFTISWTTFQHNLS
ncbi:MAG: hypothetical protein H8E84_05690 [Flavobacteriales bacterium]|nr:hypothetical protein [Flavobacteriales bacterium]